MKTIYKYTLDAGDRVRIPLPRDAVVLSIQEQDGQAVMWALVDTDKPLVDREFRIIGTGYSIPESPEHLIFIGTLQLRGLGLVFHIFEVKATP